MQSLKRSLRFRWSSSQMEANLEASDLTATELPQTYLKAFHSLIALDSSSAFSIREACGHFRRPRKKKLQHSESCAATKQTQALYWLRLPASVQMWFETTRFVYFVKLKHASRTFFDLKLQRTAFQSKNAPKRCSQSSQELPNVSKVPPGAPRRRPERPHTPQERPRSVPDTPKWPKCNE